MLLPGHLSKHAQFDFERQSDRETSKEGQQQIDRCTYGFPMQRWPIEQCVKGEKSKVEDTYTHFLAHTLSHTQWCNSLQTHYWFWKHCLHKPRSSLPIQRWCIYVPDKYMCRLIDELKKMCVWIINLWQLYIFNWFFPSTNSMEIVRLHILCSLREQVWFSFTH